MSEIIDSIPWSCDGKDRCSVVDGWHMGQYWIQDDGRYTYDEFSDGDHEDVDEADLPTAAQHAAGWASYDKYVVETGTDPLFTYMVSYTTEHPEDWSGLFIQADGKVALAKLMRDADGAWIDPTEAPGDVQQYFNVAGIESLLELAGIVLAKGTPLGADRLSVHDTVIRKFPVPQAEIAAQLRELAGKHTS